MPRNITTVLLHTITILYDECLFKTRFLQATQNLQTQKLMQLKTGHVSLLLFVGVSFKWIKASLRSLKSLGILSTAKKEADATEVTA